MLTIQDVREFNDIRGRCDSQRDYLNSSLNRMHLATTYEELEEWFYWSKIHLREFDKLLHAKVQFLVEHREK